VTAPVAAPGSLLEALEREDGLPLFASLVGFPLTDWQAAGLVLRSLFTVIIGARQVGKSRALAVLACWWALRRPGQVVLILSASEDGAKRLLREVRTILAGPLLSESVVDEQAGLVVLDNGSRIVAVAQSERAVRGERVDLLLVDESSTVSDDVFEGAALPTITARAASGARVVLAGTPWGVSGWFFRYATLGDSGRDPEVQTVRWRIADCPWVPPSFVERMRVTMTDARFRSEYEGEFVDAGSGLFSRTDLMASAAPYRMTHPLEASQGTVLLGCDWGNRNDFHGLVALGALDDANENGWPVFFVAWAEASQRTYDEQVALVESMGKRGRAAQRAYLPGPTQFRRINTGPRGMEIARVFSEANGPGQWPTERLEARLPGKVARVNTTQASKEVAFGRLAGLLAEGRLLLPVHDVLLRQLGSLEVTPTANGGQRIAAPGAQHDDLALALSFAALGLEPDVRPGRPSPISAVNRDGALNTESGIWTPLVPQARDGGMGLDRYVVRGY
jgi:hypothetical protein